MAKRTKTVKISRKAIASSKKSTQHCWLRIVPWTQTACKNTHICQSLTAQSLIHKTPRDSTVTPPCASLTSTKAPRLIRTRLQSKSHQSAKPWDNKNPKVQPKLKDCPSSATRSRLVTNVKLKTSSKITCQPNPLWPCRQKKSVELQNPTIKEASTRSVRILQLKIRRQQHCLRMKSNEILI